MLKFVYDISGQSYKHFTLVNYDSRVVHDLKIPHITTLEWLSYERIMFLRLATCPFLPFLQLTFNKHSIPRYSSLMSGVNSKPLVS